MENLDWLLQGFEQAATPMNLLYAVIDVLLGTAVGVLPGIGPAMAVALLLPITYNVSPSAASSCSPAFTTVECTAARLPRSC